MIRSREVFSPLLEHALVANRVLSCLRHDDVKNEECRQALDDAIQFLNKMLNGQSVSTSMTIRDDSYQNALAYEEGMKAFSMFLPPAAAGDSVRYIRTLEQTASALKEGTAVSAESRGRLEQFFFAMREIKLKAEAKPVEEIKY